jgi:UDP-3-O-[3-hydroxymyristoyl] glucosamine N-acyltransferase
MKLSQYIPQDAYVLKDGEYDAMGFLNQGIPSLFVFLRDKKYLNELENNKNISCILCKNEFVEYLSDKDYGIMISPDSDIDYYKIHNYLTGNRDYIRPSQETEIHQSSCINSLASIAVRNVKIGKNCVIEEFVSIKENVTIGDNVIIRSGTVIGSEGFQFRRGNNTILPVIHAGGVIIEDNVEIHSNSVVDKALFPWDNTVIGEESKLDNLVHIAHACKIGRRCFITAGTIIAGSVVVGDDAWIAPGSIIIDRVTIGEKSFVGIGSVVIRKVPDNQTVFGIPAKVISE